jgi:hypothetical protein
MRLDAMLTYNIQCRLAINTLMNAIYFSLLLA